MTIAAISQTAQYLTLKLQDEVFAVEVANVREILEYTNITKVPRTPEFMRGVINVRGRVVPVVDLILNIDRVFSGEELDAVREVISDSGQGSEVASGQQG